jgi:hypothetical protein
MPSHVFVPGWLGNDIISKSAIHTTVAPQTPTPQFTTHHSYALLFAEFFELR